MHYEIKKLIDRRNIKTLEQLKLYLEKDLERFRQSILATQKDIPFGIYFIQPIYVNPESYCPTNKLYFHPYTIIAFDDTRMLVHRNSEYEYFFKVEIIPRNDIIDATTCTTLSEFTVQVLTTVHRHRAAISFSHVPRVYYPPISSRLNYHVLGETVYGNALAWQHGKCVGDMHKMLAYDERYVLGINNLHDFPLFTIISFDTYTREHTVLFTMELEGTK
ncbi:hypothetical protein [Microcystis phage Mel-JY01]